MEYPDRTAGYPRVYVADRKHANYPTNSYCDQHGGEPLGIHTNSDDCDSQRTSIRLEVGPQKNIGSRSSPFLDCMVTDSTNHPTTIVGRTECYWTVKPFTGWYGVAPSAGAYSDHLNVIGF